MIDVSNLSFSYSKKPFIEDMSFSVGAGEVFGFLGPSGAGKSTVQKILTGMISSYSGSVRVLGTDIKKRRAVFMNVLVLILSFRVFLKK